MCFLGMANRGCNINTTVGSLFGLGVETAFVAAWVWILNYICKNGYTMISWGLVLLPFAYLIAIADVRAY